MHIAGRDRADFAPRKSQSKRDVQQPSRQSLPQGVKTGLSLAVFYVRGEHERYVEKNLLDFGLADLVFVCALVVVTGIPIEPFDLLEVDHAGIFS
jgi:hypothetical protein